MAQRGRQYPYLPARDLAIPLPNLQGRQPYYWRVEFESTSPLNEPGWFHSFIVSELGTWDYINGGATWEVLPPPGADPTTKLVIRYALNFNSAFSRYWFEWYKGGTLRGVSRISFTISWAGFNPSPLFPWTDLTTPLVFQALTCVIRPARWTQLTQDQIDAALEPPEWF